MWTAPKGQTINFGSRGSLNFCTYFMGDHSIHGSIMRGVTKSSSWITGSKFDMHKKNCGYAVHLIAQYEPNPNLRCYPRLKYMSDFPINHNNVREIVKHIVHGATGMEDLSLMFCKAHSIYHIEKWSGCGASATFHLAHSVLSTWLDKSTYFLLGETVFPELYLFLWILCILKADRPHPSK